LKILHTTVCLGVLGLAAISASYASARIEHDSVAGPDRLTNAELLALSDKELRLWVHGAFAGLGHGLTDAQQPRGRCIWDWYFGNEDRFPTIKAAMERYPQAGPSATIIAITGRACPS